MNEPIQPAQTRKSLIKAVKRRIMEEPFEMGSWCGTACCIAGNVCLATGFRLIQEGLGATCEKDGKRRLVPTVAREALGIETGELFFVSQWPADLQKLHKTQPREAACLALDWFTREEGA